MRVLIGCERSGVVRRAFRARGHDAWSCDLEPADDGDEHHFQCDVRLVLSRDCWDLGIFHPDCTYLTVSGLHWNKRRPERAALTEEALVFVDFLLKAPIERVALENPIGCISTRICKPDQIIQPNQFGEDASKATCLWLKNLPPLVPTKHIPPSRYVCCGLVIDVDLVGLRGCPNCCGDKIAKPRWANQTDSGQNRLGPSDTRKQERSATYPGIAAAFAQQWG